MTGKIAVLLYTLIFFAVNSLSVYAGAKELIKSPAVKPVQTKAPIQIKAQPSNEPVIESVSELNPRLEAGGGEVDIVLKGKNLDKLTSGQVLMNNLPARDIEGRLGPPSPTMRKVILKANEKAQIGSNYQLRLMAGTKTIDVSLTVSNITVEKLKEVKKPAQPGGLNPKQVKMQEMRLRPKTVNTEPLTMTGLRFQGKSISTEPLTMTGMRFNSKTVNTEPLTMTGLRFQGKSISTEPLTMTGMRFNSKTVNTEPLTMTGLRFQGKSISTEPLTMTGMRWKPKVINTEPLTMTGMRKK